MNNDQPLVQQNQNPTMQGQPAAMQNPTPVAPAQPAPNQSGPTIITTSENGGGIKRWIIIVVVILLILALAGGLYYFLTKQAEPIVPAPQKSTQTVSQADPLEEELSKLDPGNPDQDFAEVDQNLSSL